MSSKRSTPNPKSGKDSGKGDDENIAILEAKLKDSEAERIRDRDTFEERMREMQEENLASQRRAEKIAQEVADLTRFLSQKFNPTQADTEEQQDFVTTTPTRDSELVQMFAETDYKKPSLPSERRSDHVGRPPKNPAREDTR